MTEEIWWTYEWCDECLRETNGGCDIFIPASPAIKPKESGAKFCVYCGKSIEPPVQTCTWTRDEHYDMWETGCGEAQCIENDGPKENGMKFCCYCGKVLVEANPIEEDEEVV